LRFLNHTQIHTQ